MDALALPTMAKMRASTVYAMARRGGRQLSTRRRPAFARSGLCSHFQREKRDAHPPWINRHQRPGGKRMLVCTQRCNDRIPHGCGSGILAAHLDDAGTGRPGGREQRTKIQIMGEYDAAKSPRPAHDLGIRRGRVSNIRPMDGLPSRARKYQAPFRGQVHIDQDSHRIAVIGNSLSSARHEP